jgi:uncharacterized protein (DUF1330 family)
MYVIPKITVADKKKIQEFISPAQDALHTLQAGFAPFGDSETAAKRRKVIDMINGLAELWIQLESEIKT